MNTETGIPNQLWNELLNYISALDWSYILTFIIIAYGINSNRFREQLRKRTRLSWKSKYRVAITGTVYAVALYFIRDYSISMIEPLFQSFVFAVVFHELIIEGVRSFIIGRYSRSIAKKNANCNHHNINLNGNGKE